MVTIINPETHYVGTTPPTPVPEFGQVVIYGYTVTQPSISNVSGGTVEITDEEMFNMYFSPDYIGDVTFPITVTIDMSGPDVWEWQAVAVDADSNYVSIDTWSMESYLSIVPTGSYPTQVSFRIDSVGGVSVDKSTTSTRTLSDQTEFNTLSPTPDRTVLYDDVPVVAIKEVAVGHGITYIDNDFLSGAKNLDTVNLAEATSVTSIGNNFLYECENFNAPIVIPSNVQTIGGSFLGYCISFNSTVTISSGVHSISQNFLVDCSSFNQPLTIPSSVTSIGNTFLFDCTKFNSALTIDTSTTVGVSFLRNCRLFNQPIPMYTNGNNGIPDNYMTGCAAFNQPITFPTGITSIGQFFLGGCTVFNQPFTIPNTVTTIGTNFLYNSTSFNQPISLPSGMTSISSSFLGSCAAFNQTITMPNSITRIYDSFLGSCTSYNKEIILSTSLQVIEGSFLSNCTSFNQNITLPNGLETIENGFLSRCYAFNKNLILPTSLISIGSSFMSSMRAMVGYVDVGSLPATMISTDNSTLSSDGNSYAAYTTGIKIKGANRSAWLSKFPNKSSWPYRKLVNYGS